MPERESSQGAGKATSGSAGSSAKSCCLPASTDTLNRLARPAKSFSQSSAARKDVVWIDGGSAIVGTPKAVLPIDGEGPPRTVRLRPYGIDRFAVSNDRFAAFIAETGYITEAEHFGWSFVFRGFVSPAILHTTAAAPEAPWWVRIDGACWKHPEGPDSDIGGRKDHPAVHVSWSDACAFATWADGRLPSEAEWEHAARGHRGGVYPWGDRDPNDAGYFPCNIWQGRFPEVNLTLDGHSGTAPVSAFEANDLGLYNMVGNTWEWCEDPFRVRSLSRVAKIRNEAARQQQQRLMKGGSYLCHSSYCHRYRIAARLGCPPDSATGHLGFRLAYDPESVPAANDATSAPQ